MKVLKLLGILLLLVIVLGLVGSLLLPKNAHVEREVTIDAPIDVVWAQVNSFEESSKWSPWMKIDTNMKHEVIGEDGSVGSTLKWTSDHPDVGNGKQQFTVIDNEKFRTETDIWFDQIEEANASSYLQLETAEDGKTIAKWGFDMPTPFGVNVLMTIMDMKGSIAKDYDEGLENLKVQAEEAKNAVPETPQFEVTVEHRPARTYLGKRREISVPEMKE